MKVGKYIVVKGVINDLLIEIFIKMAVAFSFAGLETSILLMMNSPKNLTKVKLGLYDSLYLV